MKEISFLHCATGGMMIRHHGLQKWDIRGELHRIFQIAGARLFIILSKIYHLRNLFNA